MNRPPTEETRAGEQRPNDVFLRALRREQTPYTPIWLMRQAGRYLPEYNATRAIAGDFMSLCRTPELACEVTLQPLERFPLDAAILFSDILTIPDAMGLGLTFVDGEGPKFRHPLRTEADILRLGVPDPTAELGYVLDAVRTIRGALAGRVPLIGFSGSPWTLACYMIEGGGSADFRHARSLLYRRPDLMRRLLDVNTEAVSAYLNAQIEAGAQAVMLFDTWGGNLADGHFQSFSLAYLERVVRSLRTPAGLTAPVPVIVFTKGGGQWLEALAGIGAAAVGVDWTVDLGQARRRIGDRCAIQGNLDPMALLAGPKEARREAVRTLESFGRPTDGQAHIFNLGHGINQFTPPENVLALVETVHEHSRKQRLAG
ncbi:MAG: uroporphyrinogen decarboxylase [Burkholderiaceae bacterium]|nr:uroporphyrinogen decarboxylase [Burkholderiaceae bacterium]